VYPAEVEGVLAGHPAVDRCAVVGIAQADLGEIGVAFVVPVVGSTPELTELRTWCRDRLSDYKAPDRLVIVDDLPVTAMMKVDKRALAARVRRAEMQEEA
jgi:acyl-CoA synthetase (AMP-forming)/AMP-acid ligase II